MKSMHYYYFIIISIFLTCLPGCIVTPAQPVYVVHPHTAVVTTASPMYLTEYPTTVIVKRPFIHRIVVVN